MTLNEQLKRVSPEEPLFPVYFIFKTATDSQKLLAVCYNAFLLVNTLTL